MNPNPLILLLLLGITTYLIVRRVSGFTRTPVWILWVVAMMPAFIWTGWLVTRGSSRQPIPILLLIVPFIICFLLYGLLVQVGRTSSPAVNSSTSARGITPSPSGDASVDKDVPALRPIDAAEEQRLHTCFPWGVFYLQSIECRPQAVVCRGQLRSKPEVAYQTIRENVEAAFGDRFLVMFQEGLNGKPFFALVPNPRAQGSQPKVPEVMARPAWAIGLLLATIVTTSLAWGHQLIGKPLPAEQGAYSLVTLTQGLPYALSLMTILGVHELAHYLTARRHRIQVTLPYFIPVPPNPVFPFGTLGAFIRMGSPIPHRRALFDVGISGPLCGFIVALPVLLIGLARSEVVSLPENPPLFNLQAFDPRFSLLMTLTSKLVLGGTLAANTGIHLDSIALAGFLGLVVTAFNLMPVGQLDGGHIVHAMLGHRHGAMLGQIARLLLLLLSIPQPHLLPWAIFLFFMPANDEPTLNDVTGLDNCRDWWGIAALAILLLIILPSPPSLNRLLSL